MKTKYLIPVFCLLFASACKKPYHSNPNYSVVFPDTPVNMGDINSEYDDYNSTASFVGNTFPFCFSTNRNSNGNRFDIRCILLDVNFGLTDGKLTVSEFKGSGLSDVYIENKSLRDAMPVINTSGDEFGPHLIYEGQRTQGSINMDGRYESYLLLYASNVNGDLDIKMTENLGQEQFNAPVDVKFLNSAKDDAYPSLMYDSSAVYFCSNRDSDFDIYKADLDGSMNLWSNFTRRDSATITKDLVLSSGGDDKCPFISNKLMVFTSNRAGGFGGFDLWYSRLVEGQWTAPVNFGPSINTKYDEYRPIISYINGFANYFMVFSSNCPGGKGGFDLYYVGVEKGIVE